MKTMGKHKQYPPRFAHSSSGDAPSRAECNDKCCSICTAAVCPQHAPKRYAIFHAKHRADKRG